MKVIRAVDLKEKVFEYKKMSEMESVKRIIDDVKERGDSALRKYTGRFDQVRIDNLRVERAEIRKCLKRVDKGFVKAIRRAAANIKRFAKRQKKQFKAFEYEIEPGVIVGQKIIPIKRIGVYVPGGRFPLASTILMCAIPAQVAGVKEIAVCSPPSHNGSINPVILAAADIIGLTEIYRVGGTQAIAAMAYGTETIRKVDKVVGPGNKYVTCAKKEVFGIVGIDFIAGPSEIMIIADDSADLKIIASDLLAQAEHDPDAVPILITDSSKVAREVKEEIRRQLKDLKTRNIAKWAIEKNGLIIIVRYLKQAIEIANKKAPEHLELQIRRPSHYVNKLKNYGSLFIGRYSAEVLGDYSSGMNHTLPTNTAARYTGGLSVGDFLKIQTTLKVTRKGMETIGPTAKKLAEIEGLEGHKRSIEIRLED